jgi:DNA-binding PadR family transcriptional regulator
VQVTVATAKVLAAFLDTQPRYGLELMRETGLQSGTMYPILARLERAGWVDSAAEDVAPQSVRRRYYRLTGKGDAAARLCRAALAL